MDIQTAFVIFLIILAIFCGVAYYFLRKLDIKNKDKYPEKFDGNFFVYHVPKDGEYLCKRYWFWQVEKKKFLESKIREIQESKNLSGCIYSRRAVKRGRGHIGEKGRIIPLRELFIKIN